MNMDRHDYRQALNEIRKGLRFAGAASYNAATDYREGAPREAIARRLSDVERGVTDAIREVDDAIARDERDHAWQLRAEEAEKKLRAAERERDDAQAAIAAEQAAHAETRKALAAERARVERMTSALCAFLDATQETPVDEAAINPARRRAVDAMSDTPAQAPSVDTSAVSHAVQALETLGVLCQPSPAGSVVLPTGAEAPRPATLDDLAAMERRVLLAVAEEAEAWEERMRFSAALRARAGQ